MRLGEIVASDRGGNVFKDADGNSLTRRILLPEIDPTIKWLEALTGLPLYNNTLGSVRKKKSSKDLDLAVDQNKISKDDLVSILSRWVTKQKGNTPEWIKKSGISVHFKTPIGGDPTKGYVQTDFMFGDDVEQMKFGLFSAGDQSQFSGADRNLIMSSIAKSLPDDLKYSWQKSLIRRSTGELISKDPEQIANVLLGTQHSSKDLESVETIANAIRKDQSRIDALKRLIISLRGSNGKKPGESKADAEEADRITKFFVLIS
jgi:hypothetical protein